MAPPSATPKFAFGKLHTSPERYTQFVAIGINLRRYEKGIFDRLFKPNVKMLQKMKYVKGLIKALRYKDWSVRREAAEALGRIGDVRAVEPLIQALKDEYWDVRLRAEKALEKIEKS